MLTRVLTNRVLHVVLVYFVIVVAFLLLADTVSQATSIPFNPQPITLLQQKKPAYVFIGDSMLETRVDEKTFEQVSGKPTTVLFRGGSASAQWYLVYKNYVVASGINPNRVVIFFRDTYLTDAAYRTTGKYAQAIRLLRTDTESTYDKVLAQQDLAAEERVTSFFAAVGKIYDVQGLYQHELNTLSTRVVTKGDPEYFGNVVDRKFQLDQLREVEDDDTGGSVDLRKYRFAERVQTSFLPEIVALAQQQQQSILFVRVKRRPDAQGVTPQSPELVQYVNDLKLYLLQQGMLFYDFTDDTSQKVEIYRDGDHIRDAAGHTPYVYDKLKPLLQ